MLLVQGTSQPPYPAKNSATVPHPVVVGLGGNLGSVRETFALAIENMAKVAELVAVSALYRSAPVGPAQPDFLNAAVLLSWSAPLADLLFRLHEIEAAAARVRDERWGPRTLDLDILWAGERVVSTPELVVPHVELRNRAFAILPLLDLVPNAFDPNNLKRYDSTLLGISGARVERIAQDRWWEALPLF